MDLFIFLSACVVVGLVFSVLLYSCVRVQKRALLDSDSSHQEHRPDTLTASTIYTVPQSTMFSRFDKLPNSYDGFHSPNYIAVPPPPSYEEATAERGPQKIDQQRMHLPSLVR